MKKIKHKNWFVQTRLRWKEFNSLYEWKIYWHWATLAIFLLTPLYLIRLILFTFLIPVSLLNELTILAIHKIKTITPFAFVRRR